MPSILLVLMEKFGVGEIEPLYQIMENPELLIMTRFYLFQN